jgi:hypothetical protein
VEREFRNYKEAPRSKLGIDFALYSII